MLGINIRTKLIIVTILIATLVSVLIPSAFARPQIDWVPESVIIEIEPGTEITVVVSITSSTNLKNARLIMSPTLIENISIEHSVISLRKHRSQEITLTITAETNSVGGVIEGVLEVHHRKNKPRPHRDDKNHGEAHQKDKDNTALEQDEGGFFSPLPITLVIVEEVTLDGTDLNMNGIRDAVEEAIGMIYDVQDPRYNVALAIAKSNQQSLRSDYTDDVLKANYALGVEATICLSTTGENITRLLATLDEIQFDTAERRDANRAFQYRLAAFGALDELVDYVSLEALDSNCVTDF